MSVSLYYTAKRKLPISKQEQKACEEIAEKYIEDYPLGEMYESFCIYDLTKMPLVEENVIFDGATKLPIDEGEEHFKDVCDYWGDCLQEIIDVLPGAKWNIHIDDADVTPYFDYPEK